MIYANKLGLYCTGEHQNVSLLITIAPQIKKNI